VRVTVGTMEQMRQCNAALAQVVQEGAVKATAYACYKAATSRFRRVRAACR